MDRGRLLPSSRLKEDDYLLEYAISETQGSLLNPLSSLLCTQHRVITVIVRDTGTRSVNRGDPKVKKCILYFLSLV